jgi:dipeptidyl aminopeptidase/acylaminoacyl peptidase
MFNSVATCRWQRALPVTLALTFCLAPMALAEQGGVVMVASHGSLLAINLANPRGAHTLFVNHAAFDRNPAFSASTRMLAFDRTISGSRRMVYVASADRVLRRLSEGWAPDFSPDGKRVVFASERGLTIMDVATSSHSRQLTNDPNDNNPNWGSNDQIVFERLAGGRRSIVAMSPDDSVPEQVIPLDFDLTNPSWAPDAKTLLVSVKAEGGPTCSQQRERKRFAPIREYNAFIFASASCNPSGTWSPSGRQVLIPRQRDMVIVKPGQRVPEQIICQVDDPQGVDWSHSDVARWLLASPARHLYPCNTKTGPTLTWFRYNGKWRHISVE